MPDGDASADPERERRLVGAFVFMRFAPGLIALTAEHVEAIEAAQQRLFRQIRANSANGKKGAPKPVKADRRSVQLREAKRRQRANENEKENKMSIKPTPFPAELREAVDALFPDWAGVHKHFCPLCKRGWAHNSLTGVCDLAMDKVCDECAKEKR